MFSRVVIWRKNTNFHVHLETNDCIRQELNSKSFFWLSKFGLLTECHHQAILGSPSFDLRNLQFFQTIVRKRTIFRIAVTKGLSPQIFFLVIEVLTAKILKAMLAIEFWYFTWKQAIVSRFIRAGTSWWVKASRKVKVAWSPSWGGGDLQERTREVELAQLVIVSGWWTVCFGWSSFVRRRITWPG